MPSAGVAGVRLECTAESRSGAALALDVVAVNAGDEPPRDVRPEVVYEHQTYSGEAAALDPGAAVALDGVAVNAGGERARDVRPEVVYEHQTYSGEAAALDPGARREWQIPLAPPAAPGTFAATVRIHYVDALGRGSVPVVIQVPAPDGSPGPVRLGLSGRGERD